MWNDLGVFASSLGAVLSWPTFGFLLIGMSLGFVVGILPGLGGSATLALMLPFTFAMDPVTAFAFLLGMGAVTATTGDLTSILFGIPGEPSSAATVLDGHPMAARGEPGRAVGIALVSSLIGAILGAFFLAFAVQMVRPVVLRFGPPEFFIVAVVALAFVSTLSGRAQMKGLMMACLGILIASVGQDPGTGRLRLTFDVPYLMDGISIVPVVVGLFAVPSVLAMMSGTKDANSMTNRVVKSTQGWVTGARDALRHKWLIVRCSGIGIFFGMLPGIGGSSSQFIAYAHAKQTSKNPQEFGTGAVEGIVAAGSVNNAKEGGDLVPTVGFGVPGSAQMAILLSAFMITGLTPGPAMLTDHLDVTFSMVWTLVVANIITVALCLIFLKQICSITEVPAARLVPFLLLFISLGAFTASNSWNDVLLMLAFGALAIAANSGGWPLPPLLLGLVLGSMVESNFFLSYSLADRSYSWVGRPIVLFFMGLLVLTIMLPLIRKFLRRNSASRALELDELAQELPSKVTAASLVVNVLMLAFSIYVIWQFQFADEIPLRTKQFPLLAAMPMGILAVAELIKSVGLIRAQRREKVSVTARTREPVGSGSPFGADEEFSREAELIAVAKDDDKVAPWAVLHFAGFFACLYAFGFIVGAPLFTFVYLLFKARVKIWWAAAGAALAYLFLWGVFTQLVPIPLMPSQIFGF